ARAAPSGPANGPRLTETPGGMEQGDPAQGQRARPSREHLEEHLTHDPERVRRGGALDRRHRDLAPPVPRSEGPDDLARAASDHVAILPERGEVDLPGQLRDLGALHARAQITPRDAEPPT